MPVTLAQAKLNTQDKIQAGVIDEFRKSSFLIDNITFDDTVSPVGQGKTMTYGYTRVVTQPTAATRAINSEYTPQEATKQRYTTDLKVFGGAYQIDRVLSDVGGLVDEVTFQSSQKAKAAAALFGDMVINGDSAIDANAFDGLDKAITGSSTEYNTTTAIDLSSAATVATNAKAFDFLLSDFLGLLDGQPSALAGNYKLMNRIKAVARELGYYEQTKDDFGRRVETYAGIPLVDLGAKPGSTDPVCGIDGVTGVTTLYVVRFGLDGFHAASKTGTDPIKYYLPDFNTPGAVKTGEVEMVAAVVLKATRAAGAFRKIKVQ